MADRSRPWRALVVLLFIAHPLPAASLAPGAVSRHPSFW
jgi:hypothetical protein